MDISFTPQVPAGRSLIRMGGEGVLPFLQNLITAELGGMPKGRWAHGALLSPQGKIQHELFVFNAGNAVYLDCVHGQRDALLKKLMLYRLRAKFEIAMEDGLSVVVSPKTMDGLSGPDPRLAAIGHRGLSRHGAPADGSYDTARLKLGLPDGAADIGENRHFPHEANFDLLNGVSFTKGCYVGQEVVSRMQHRGSARTRMLPVACDGATPGAVIHAGETMIGTILSARGGLGLALLRLDRLQETAVPLLSAGVRVSVRKPSWMALDFDIPGVAP